jgi:hypothetical protein
VAATLLDYLFKAPQYQSFCADLRFFAVFYTAVS